MKGKKYDSRIALLIGINDYKRDPLDAPVDDVERLAEILSKHEDGTANFKCTTRTSSAENPKRLNQGVITREMRAFFRKKADIAIFYFSGHGKVDELGGYIVVKGATKNDPGVPFSNIIDLALISKIPEIILIFDCCHSGAAGMFGRFGKKISMLREGITVLSASKDDQPAIQMTTAEKSESLFTSILYDGLEGGAADILGNVTVGGLYGYADQMLSRFDQRPIFKSDVSEMIAVRSCKPKIPLEILKKITTHFKEKDEVHALDPSYEPTEEPRHKVHEKIFSQLQKYRNQGLVEPTGGEEHMYYAAMHSTGCKLTFRGKLYWELVKAKRI